MQSEPYIHDPQYSAVATRITAGAAVVVFGGLAAIGTFFDPSQENFFPVCPLFKLTGFACPGCGLTRGFHALFHGDVLTAMDFNALTPVWAVIFGYVWISLLLLTIRGRGLPMWPTNPTFMWTFMIVLLTFGIVRNIPVWPLSMLFP